MKPKCPTCKGNGKYEGKKCWTCNGKGSVDMSKVIRGPKFESVPNA